jgi:hypothetical protein
LTLRLGFRTLAERHGEQAVLERGVDLVRVDALADLERALELAVPALAVDRRLVFPALLPF